MKHSQMFSEYLTAHCLKVTRLPILGWPDLVVGERGRETYNPYMLRWHLFRVANLPRLYLHKFVRSDDDRALHDHPWWYVSLLIRGGYTELTPDGPVRRSAPSIVFRPITHQHRVVLLPDGHGGERPCWTLFLTGPDVRRWGFWCGERFIVSKDFSGCGE